MIQESLRPSTYVHDSLVWETFRKPGTTAVENNRSTADPLIPAKLILKVTAGNARAARLAPPGLYVTSADAERGGHGLLNAIG